MTKAVLLEGVSYARGTEDPATGNPLRVWKYFPKWKAFRTGIVENQALGLWAPPLPRGKKAGGHGPLRRGTTPSVKGPGRTHRGPAVFEKPVAPAGTARSVSIPTPGREERGPECGFCVGRFHM